MNTQEAIDSAKICFTTLKHAYPGFNINDAIFNYYDLTLRRCSIHKLKIFFDENGFKKLTLDDKELSDNSMNFNWVLSNFQCLSDLGDI